jgi:hypothetical protein
MTVWAWSIAVWPAEWLCGLIHNSLACWMTVPVDPQQFGLLNDSAGWSTTVWPAEWQCRLIHSSLTSWMKMWRAQWECHLLNDIVTCSTTVWPAEEQYGLLKKWTTEQQYVQTSNNVAYTKKNVTCWRTVWPTKEEDGMLNNRGLPKHDVTAVARGSLRITAPVLHIPVKTVWHLCVHQLTFTA